MADKKKELIEQALQMSAKYLGDGKTFDNEIWESQGDINHKRRLKLLKRELLKSKEAVFRQLQHKRAIERKLLLADQTELGLKKKLADRVKDPDDFKVATKIRDPLERRTLNLQALTLIEIAAKSKPGAANLVQGILEGYNDDELKNNLSNIPDEIKQTLSAKLFGKIALSASSRYITVPEAIVIYKLALESNSEYDYDYIQKRWNFMSNMMRKKLMKIHLGKEYHKSFESLAKIRMPEFFYPGADTAIIGPTPSINSPTRHRNHSSSMSNNQSHDLINMNSPTKLMSKSTSMVSHKEKALLSRMEDPAKGVARLQAELLRSKSMQDGHHSSIVKNLASLVQEVPLNAEKSQGAWEFSKRMGARKLEVLLASKAENYQRQAIQRWTNLVKLNKSEDSALTLARFIGVARLVKYFDEIFNAKLKRGFNKFCGVMNNLEDMEHTSAIVEIQRVVRGALGKIRRFNLERYYAAQRIQKIARGNHGKKIGWTKKREKELRGAVHVVEKAWKNQIWMRTLKKIRKMRDRHRKALTIQRCYRGHVGRIHLRKAWRRFKRRKGAIKFQSLFRAYKAKVYVTWYAENKLRISAVTRIQTVARIMLSKLFVRDYAERNSYAGAICRFILCRNAIFKVTTVRYRTAACNIQRYYRGYKGRKRVKRLRNAKKKAKEMMFKYIWSWYTRLVWIPIINDHKFRRCNAANIIKAHLRAVLKGVSTRKWWAFVRSRVILIQTTMRIYLAKARIIRVKLARVDMYATRIQRRIRGILGRRRFKRKVAEFEEEERIRNMPPKYYLMKMQYYREQNMFHRPYILKIQCAFRCITAWKKVNLMRRIISAKVIQKRARDWLAVKEAQREMKRRRYELYMRNKNALIIQRVARGMMARYEVRKHYHAELIKWFLHETHATGLVGKALQIFRVRKKNLERAHKKASKIQALVRGVAGRTWMRQNLKRLKKELEKRKHKKRVKATIVIQCMLRKRFAKAVFAKKLIEYEEHMKEKRALEELEEKLDDIHEGHLNNLMSTRIQSKARKGKARLTYAQKKLAALESVERRRRELLFGSAQKIQALGRGHVYRLRHTRNLPGLLRDKQKRAFCVECESVLAVKRCRSCRDRYCAPCFDKIHKKGKRLMHGWDPIIDERKSKSRTSTAGGEGGGRTGRGRTPQVPVKKDEPEWEEYYDEAAGAKYWYNPTTGEASWIDPTPKKKR